MRGPTVLKASDDKTRPLNKHTLMAYSGEAGDTGMHALTVTLSDQVADTTPSPIRGVRSSQHPALQQAQRLRIVTIRGLLLRA
jgi:20S proteasome alpha/beta subunit